MEPEAIARLHRDLIEWGVVERDEIELTRRFRGALVRAAARLQAEERDGARRPGHPVANAVDEALREFPLPPGAVAGAAHRAFLVALHVESLPANVRTFLGV